MTPTCRPIAAVLAGVLLLAGCSGKDAPLPGILREGAAATGWDGCEYAVTFEAYDL